jgi:hypothetical protein
MTTKHRLEVHRKIFSDQNVDNSMVGRKKIENEVLECEITFIARSGVTYVLKKVRMTCPDCGSTEVRPFGTRKLKETRVIALVCRNPDCPREGKKTPRQFSPHTSGAIKVLVNGKIQSMIREIYVGGSKAKSVACSHGVSETFVSFLRDDIDEAIANGLIKDDLVDEPTSDEKVSIDETFFEIGKKKIYVIITRGYKTRKVLGIHVSLTRKEADIRVSFDEAQRNTINRITTISCDAWSATKKMAKNLLYPLTLIVHKHKKPYDKAVIERYEYDGSNRKVTLVGIKTDVFTKRGKREIRYEKHVETTVPPPPNPKGRPKGSKNKPRKTRKKNDLRRGGDQKGSTRFLTVERRDTSRSFPVNGG